MVEVSVHLEINLREAIFVGQPIHPLFQCYHDYTKTVFFNFYFTAYRKSQKRAHTHTQPNYTATILNITFFLSIDFYKILPTNRKKFPTILL